MNEIALEIPAEITTSPDGGVKSNAEPVQDDDTINKMKVAEMCTALEAQGLSKNGPKAVLVKQLKTAQSRLRQPANKEKLHGDIQSESV